MTNNITKKQIELILSEWRIGLLDGSWCSDLELSCLQARLLKFLDSHDKQILDHELESLLNNDSLGG